ncbi:MAG: glutaredoxin domain-containing protein [Syntrophotaleaceae bacterium]
MLVCIALLALVLNWGRISSYFNPPPIPSNTDSQVVMFSTEWCGYCEQARALFKSADVSYHEYDIEKSAEGFKQYQALGGRGVPLLIINGKLLRGFDKRQILRALAND